MKVFLNKMNKYISKFLLKFLIKNLKFLSKYTNIAIKYLNNNKRFSLIKRNIKFIRSIIIETRLYKFYKLYKRTIKIITIFHLLIILYYTRFKIEFDYIAFITLITTILGKLIYHYFDNELIKFKEIILDLAPANAAAIAIAILNCYI